MAFGGGGPLHACSLVRELGMDDALIPPVPGLFSSLGLLFSEVSAQRERAIMAELRDIPMEALEEAFLELEGECSIEIGEGAEFERLADVRYSGQSFELTVPCPPSAVGIREAFEKEHMRLYGHISDGEVELVNVRCVARMRGEVPTLDPGEGRRVADIVIGEREVHWDGEWHDATVLGRGPLAEGESIEGPVVMQGYDHTLFVPPGWEMRSERLGCLRVVRG